MNKVRLLSKFHFFYTYIVRKSGGYDEKNYGVHFNKYIDTNGLR